jgi:ATP-binding cassette subfamily B protein
MARFSGLQKYAKVYRHLWQTYGQSWYVRLSYVLKVLTRAGIFIGIPVAVSVIITRLASGDYAGAGQAVIFLGAVSLMVGIITPLVKYVGMLGERHKYRAATADYFRRLVSADLDYFNSNLAGYLTTSTRQYVDSCVDLVRAIRDGYLEVILAITFPLLVIVWLNPLLGLIALLLSLVQAIYLLWASHAIDPYRARSRELYKINSGRMADVISNILAVRSNAQEQRYSELVKQGADEEADAFRARYTKQAQLIALRECITVAFFVTLLWLTVQQMAGGHLSVTAAILVITYATTIMSGIYSLSEAVDKHDELVDKILPAFEVLERQNAVQDPASPQKFNNIRGEIQFKNVSFAYEKDGSQTVLKNFSLTIKPGQKIGVVGLSGAGKSTLTKLLLRFDDVDKGQILIDGIDIRSVLQIDLRQQIAYVPQEPLLFHTSIKMNVLVAKPDASDKEVLNALQTAHALKFVKQLPQGVDSVVGERGVKLSGGQKQRVAIARAVLRHAPIMVLDEATSALDSESEQIIKDSFAGMLKDKTAIVVAHRLSTLSEMDRIIVIDNGKLTEDGTHAQLLKMGGLYASMWHRQQRHVDE